MRAGFTANIGMIGRPRGKPFREMGGAAEVEHELDAL
jgi:hypothetical protein